MTLSKLKNKTKATIINILDKTKVLLHKTTRVVVLTYIVTSGVLLILGTHYGLDLILKRIAGSQKDAFREHVVSVMHAAGVYNKFSPAYRDILIDSVMRAGNKVLETEEQREYYATLVAVESGYDREAKSKVGAIGLAQLMPQYIDEFAVACNMAGLRESDYADIQVNLMIGACRFRDLLKITGGDVAAAAVGYNAGISSSSFKQLMSGRAIESEEASNYPTKIFHLNEKAKKSPKKSNKPVAFIRQTSENEGESDAD